jgi:hypothetical protein
MKNIFRLTILLALIQFSACSDDNNGGSKSAKSTILTKEPWAHAQVSHTDGDLSSQYTNFVIVFTKNASDGFDGTYVISNGGHAFTETSGKWKFSEDFSQILFDSGKEINIELTEDHLKLDFIAPPPGGKVAGLSGHFIFELQPL